MPLFKELRRRNVFRVTVGYVVSCWLLIQIADVMLNVVEAPGWVLQALFIVAALGFPVVVFFSWAYEVTPEGIKREAEVDRSQSITHVTGRKLDRAIFVVLLISLGYFIWESRFKEGETPIAAETSQPAAIANAHEASTTEPRNGRETADPVISEQSIAVLPFVNMSDDVSNEYFSDGLSEELLNLLAQIPDLKVAARTSSFSLKGKKLQISEIGELLKVAHVLEGSVRKAGNRVRITAQLIKIDDGYHLWSETYDRTLDDIFAIQDEIAGNVVESMGVVLLGEAISEARETDPEAYALYLQCRYFGAGDREQLRKGEEYCRQSLEVDPNYAPTWASLGTVYTNLAISGYIDFKNGYASTLEYTRRALEIDPDLAYAHGGLGWHAMMYERDLQTAAEHYRIALRLAPNDSRILSGAAVLAEGLGRFDRAIELAEKSLSVNPLGWVTYGNTAIVRCWAGQFELANAWFDKALELKPRERGNPWRAKCYLLQGRPDEALAEANRIDPMARQLWILPMAYYELGQFEASEQALDALIEGHAHEAASFIAENFAWRGEIDRAFEWLDRAKKEKQYMWGSLVFDPAFSNLHSDPRWADFRAEDGRSEEQIREIDI